MRKWEQVLGGEGVLSLERNGVDNSLIISKFLSLVVCLGVFVQAPSQNVGIGTNTPIARLHIEVPSAFSQPIVQVNQQGSATPYFIILPNGNVGIGVATPSEALDVAGNVQFSGALMPGGNAGSAGQVLVSQGPGTAPVWSTPKRSDSVCTAVTTNFVQKWTGTELCNSIIYDNGTNVGIGTTSPVARFEVRDSQITDVRVHIFNAYPNPPQGYNNSGQSGNAALELRSASPGGVQYIDFAPDALNQDFLGRISYNELGKDRMAFYTAGAFRMIIDSNGYIGIGYSFPKGWLHLPHLDAGPNSPNDGASIVIGSSANYHLELDANEIHAMYDTFAAPLNLQADSGSIIIHNNMSSDKQVFIDNRGNISIGNGLSAPYKLTVQGEIAHRFYAVGPNNGVPIPYGQMYVVESDEYPNYHEEFVISFGSAGNNNSSIFIGPNSTTGGVGRVEINAALIVMRGGGNVGINVVNPTNILTVQQGSPTDPIADSWTVYSTRETKEEIIGVTDSVTEMKYLNMFNKLDLYQWRRTKKEPVRLSPIAGEEVPSEILAYDGEGNIQGIDLYGYIGFLHAVIKAQQRIIDAQEMRLSQQAKEIEVLKQNNSKIERRLADMETIIKSMSQR